MNFDTPWLLALLPLALLPLWRQPGAALANTWLVAQPRDWPSDLLGWAKFPAELSLGITFAILATGILWSMWRTRSAPPDAAEP